MKRFYSPLLFLLLCLIPAKNGFTADAVAAEPLPVCKSEHSCHRLVLADFEHIEFGRIPANKVTISDNSISMEVINSASFLMQGFADVLSVTQVSLVWKSEGKPDVPDALQEKQKNGDDAVIKLGLLLRADEKAINPFIPAWMRRVESNLKHPSTMMIYLVADARHDAGERWTSPYNHRVTMISMQDEMTTGGWHLSQVSFDEPVEVVAVWLMSDGDDTQSSFVTRVRDIVLR